MLTEGAKASCLAGFLLVLVTTSVMADDPEATPPRPASAGSFIQQLEDDAGRVADKASELGESAGESAGKAADTAAEEAENFFERAKQGGKKAYEWSKRKLEEWF